MNPFRKELGLILILFLLFSQPLWAKSGKNSNRAVKAVTGPQHTTADSTSGNKRFFILPEYKVLHSTHQDDFMGGDIIFTYEVDPTLWIGLGSGFSYDQYHRDNGWRLFRLRFFPVFIDGKMLLPGDKDLTPFLQLSEGISMDHYRRSNRPYISSYRVSERGDYLYTGIGCILKIDKSLKAVIGMGFNGYKMSFDSLDVNPHGFTFRIGMLI